MKRILLLGIIAGILSAVAGIMYLKMYEEATMVDFSPIMNSIAILGSSVLACLLMALGYVILEKLKKTNWTGFLNVLIIVLTFASIVGPISMTLPLDFEFPEMFPGLAIPMHFFPALIFFGLQPFFIKK
jgi:drug/metabolite transporter (DMT)-like permease